MLPNVHPPSEICPAPSSNLYPPRNSYPTPSGCVYSDYPPRQAYPPPSGYVYPPLRSTYPQVCPPNSPYALSYNSSYSAAPDSQPSNSTQDSPIFTLQWLTGKTRKCYGCGNSLRTDSGAVPKPLFDVVVRYKEQRYYRDPDTQTLKLTKNEENTYYHLMLKCIHMKHPSFSKCQLYIPVDLTNSLLPLHKSHLFDTFGIKF